MSFRHISIVVIFGLGVIAAMIGLYRYFHDDFRRQALTPAPVRMVPGRTSGDMLHLAMLFLIVIVALILRLEGIDLRGMSHVEVYIPGISLPSFAEPPPRLDFLSFLSWHWHDEPHPQGYYLLMFFWTKLFGTGIEAIRLPSVIFGTGAVILIYVLARMACDRKVGLIAASLLALNGHHIYWSQSARMYSMACFLVLASTILLFALLRQRHTRPGLEVAYVLVTFLGLFTQLFFWVLLAAQMLVALIYTPSGKQSSAKIFSLQVVTAILGSPLWAHAVYRSREIDLGSPSLQFVQDFLNFGFTFLPDHYTSAPPRNIMPEIELFVTAIALICLIAGLLNRSYILKFNPPLQPVDAWKKLVPLAVGFALIIVALAILAWRRQDVIAVTALVPLIALAMLPLVSYLQPRVAAIISRCAACGSYIRSSVAFVLVLGAVPVLLLILVSLLKTMMIARGFLLFVPFLLIVQAAGVEAIIRKRIFALPLLVTLAAIHLYSVDYHRKIPGPTDYRGLAHEMTKEMHVDDLVFVYPRDWVTTPLYYYFQDQQGRFIARDYADAVALQPAARVWIPTFAFYKEPSDAMRTALQDYRKIKHVSARGCAADLYAPARN